MAHVRQAWPESGLGFQADVLKPFNLFLSDVRSSLGIDVQETGQTKLFRFFCGLDFFKEVFQSVLNVDDILSNVCASLKIRSFCLSKFDRRVLVPQPRGIFRNILIPCLIQSRGCAHDHKNTQSHGVFGHEGTSTSTRGHHEGRPV